jgi:transcription antitermination factor NusG
MGPQWYCIIVEAGCQRQIRAVLADKGYRVFVPMAKRWVNHARVKKAVERPLLGRYVFVELQPGQAFLPVMTTAGVEAIISNAGAPCVIPRRQVDRLFHAQLAGRFDETRGGPPVGARVAIVSGKFENWIATVTGIGHRGRQVSVKLLGHKTTIDKLPPGALRPAFGSDLEKSNPEEIPN